ncbi:hypothetical protein ACRCPG_33695 [Pseudomonas aeruginosa]
MSEHAEQFIAHLHALKERDRGALAALRHSLAFAPGCYRGLGSNGTKNQRKL